MHERVRDTMFTIFGNHLPFSEAWSAFCNDSFGLSKKNNVGFYLFCEKQDGTVPEKWGEGTFGWGMVCTFDDDRFIQELGRLGIGVAIKKFEKVSIIFFPGSSIEASSVRNDPALHEWLAKDVETEFQGDFILTLNSPETPIPSEEAWARDLQRLLEPKCAESDENCRARLAEMSNALARLGTTINEEVSTIEKLSLSLTCSPENLSISAEKQAKKDSAMAKRFAAMAKKESSLYDIERRDDVVARINGRIDPAPSDIQISGAILDFLEAATPFFDHPGRIKALSEDHCCSCCTGNDNAEAPCHPQAPCFYAKQKSLVEEFNFLREFQAMEWAHATGELHAVFTSEGKSFSLEGMKKSAKGKTCSASFKALVDKFENTDRLRREGSYGGFEVYSIFQCCEGDKLNGCPECSAKSTALSCPCPCSARTFIAVSDQAIAEVGEVEDIDSMHAFIDAYKVSKAKAPAPTVGRICEGELELGHILRMVFPGMLLDGECRLTFSTRCVGRTAIGNVEARTAAVGALFRALSNPSRSLWQPVSTNTDTDIDDEMPPMEVEMVPDLTENEDPMPVEEIEIEREVPTIE
jgi:hypothetical protein